MSELAFTVNGDTFEVPSTVTSWRVRRLKPRGAPELVYARDGRPLTLPIEADIEDLHDAVTTSGKYRLDPIGDDGKGVENVPAAYIHVTKGERNAGPEHAIERADNRADSTIAGLGQAVIEAVRLNAEALRQNAEISMRAVDRLPQLMEAMTTMLNVATGTHLYALQQRESPPPGLRNAANDNGDEDDEDEEDGGEAEEGNAAPAMIGGFPLPPGFDINKIVSQVASDVVTKLIDKFGGKMPSVGAILDPRKAYAEGQRERAAQAAAQQAPVQVTPPAVRMTTQTPTVQPATPLAPMHATASSEVPTDPASMAHFFAVRNALTRDEKTLVVALAQELTDEQRAAWFNELLPLSVPDAVAKVRATLAQLENSQPPTPSLTTPATAALPHQGAPLQTSATSPPETVSTQGTPGQSRAS